MKRKASRVSRAAADPSAQRRSNRKPFSKVDFKRAISAARSVNLPVSRVDIGRDGKVSLVIGPAESEKANELDNWIAKHADATERP